MKYISIITIMLIFCSCKNKSEVLNMPINMNVLKLRDGKEISFQILNSDEFYDLVQSRNVENWSYGVRYFNIGDSSVFAESGDKIYFEFKTFEDFNTFFVETSSTGRHVLKYRKYFDKSILINKKIIINDFLRKIKLNVNTGKISVEFLQEVQDRIMLNENRFNLYNDNLCAIFLLIGETLNQEFNSNWRLDLDTKEQVYEPVIILNGKRIEHFTLLYQLLFIESDPNPILETYMTTKEIIKGLH